MKARAMAEAGRVEEVPAPPTSNWPNQVLFLLASFLLATSGLHLTPETIMYRNPFCFSVERLRVEGGDWCGGNGSGSSSAVHPAQRAMCHQEDQPGEMEHKVGAYILTLFLIFI